MRHRRRPAWCCTVHHGTRWSATCELAPQIDARALQRDLAATVERVDAQMSPLAVGQLPGAAEPGARGAWFCADHRNAADTGLRARHRAIEPRRLRHRRRCTGRRLGLWCRTQRTDASAIRAARALAHGPETLELDLHAGRARKLAPLQIDLCGIARATPWIAWPRCCSTTAWQALTALDGELRAIGGQADGRPWAVAIESPQTGLRRTGVLALQDLAVATSGDYRHFFDVNGQRLAHSMDAQRHSGAGVTWPR